MATAASANILPPLDETGPLAGALRFGAIASVMGGLAFNLFLCFVNTRIMPMRDSHVMLMEMAIIGTALIVAMDRRAGLYLFLGIFISYMLMLFTLRGASDLKAVRDILIPVIFYAMGSRLRDLKLADNLAVWSAIVVLFFAFFEYFLLDLYLEWFNVLGYYISKGTVTLTESYGATKGLFISGSRPEPRTILSFLGQHRVSSVFLEPVSMGNFGVIIFSWAMFRRGWSGRWFLFAAALAMVVLADARFGLFTCILIVLLAPFFKVIPRTFWLVTPFLLLALIAAYGFATGTNGGPNDLSGRIAVTAHILTELSLPVVLGVEATAQFTADSGLAYTLTKFGLFGFIALWATFIFMPFRNARAWDFHSMMIVYLLLIMVISNSFFSIKTGALMWFMAGTVSAVDIPAVKSIWSRLMERTQSRAGQAVPSADRSRRAGSRA
ncbi:MAG: rfe [Rhizobium sp.]|nr:rfe [Rhizobium sp.]